MRRKLLAACLATVTAAALAAPALGGNGGLGPVPPKSPTADRIADAYWLIAIFATAVFLIVMVPLLVFVIRYRSHGRDRRIEGPQVHGNTSFELAWTMVPVVILFVVAGFVFYKLPGIVDPARGQAVSNELTVRVQGRQFYWRYVYPNGAIGINTLRLPQGRVVRLELTAPKGDVIHSFWIPALFGKRDTIPGFETELRFIPTTLGSFSGQCGEFCGVQHAAMSATVLVVRAREFDGWLAREGAAQAAGRSNLGREQWVGVCMKCHRLNEEYVGPPLAGNPILKDEQGLNRLVRNGFGAMPAVGQEWTNREVQALYDFTRRLPGGGAAGGGQG